ncbi:methyl-accepting chemotaxis protein [Orenia metallireducens]|uniref:Methyl-accepting chemotaxis protein n=1 Tax=Orenia metallireducens TaxID=1413210 RepID=A0A285GCD2_9FIRM|nr:methyl-accepting chemotaxis protein [Orenia metallireducens]PRX19169.1 methyl-accepting chemotaxis protein [Orenia metallireducens]SNY21227.1 methyl-accepting chemotaxis protein [Orenia metallireducens]
MNLIKRTSLKKKLVAMIIVSIMLLLGATLTVVKVVVTDKAKDVAVVKVKTDLATGYDIIEQKFPGDWHLEGDKLYKGEVLMNNNFAIVDHIGQLTNDTVTIFAKNKRIATNVKKDGKRAVGTLVSEEVERKVLEEGRDYYGEANVVGHLYQTGYTPIKNAQGEIIGIWYVGASKEFVNQMISEVFNRVLLFTSLISLLIIISFYFIAVKLSKPMVEAAEFANQIAEGNLELENLEVKSEDEVGQLRTALNNMLKNLKDMVINISESVENLTASSEELSAAGDQMGEGADQVTKSVIEIATGAEDNSCEIEKISNSMGELNLEIESIENKTKDMTEISDNVLEDVKLGNQAIDHSIEMINRMKVSAQDVSGIIFALGENSKEIDEIVNLIGSIAEQTNLLALNAAIEAARAGEHGRGFAVVADEIRELAEESSVATSNIAKLISNIQNQVDKAVEQMKNSEGVVSDSVESIEDTGNRFKDIKEIALQLSQVIQSVTSHIDSMNHKSHDIKSAIDNIASVTEEFAANTEQVSASSQQQSAITEEIVSSSQELAIMSTDLSKVIDKFKL